MKLSIKGRRNLKKNHLQWRDDACNGSVFASFLVCD